MACFPPVHDIHSALNLLTEMNGGPFPCIHTAIEFGLHEALSAPNDELVEFMLEPVVVLISSREQASQYIARLELEMRYLNTMVH